MTVKTDRDTKVGRMEVADDEATSEAIQIIQLNSIAPNPFQPRAVFAEADLKELALSISELGVQQPVIVRPAMNAGADIKYQTVIGERRIRASNLVGLKTIPAIVRQVTDKDLRLIAFTENYQRKNLNVMETMDCFFNLIEDFENAKNVAQKVGVSVRSIERYLKIHREIHSTQEFEALFATQSSTVTFNTAKTFAEIAPFIRRLQRIDKREYWRTITKLNKKGIKDALPALKRKFSNNVSPIEARPGEFLEEITVNETPKDHVLTLRWSKTKPITGADKVKIQEEIVNFLAKLTGTADLAVVDDEDGSS